MQSIIKIDNLNKSYGDIKAVNDLSFKVEKGEMFAFLGVNGAGKSTTINIMCGQLRKDSGSVEIDGIDIDKNADEIKRRLGVVFQSSVLDKSLTVKDNLESRGSLYGIFGKNLKDKIEELSNMLEFKDLLSRPVGKLSGGQRRRIDIARSLIHDPQILILDEPTTGLDPQTRKNIWDVIEGLRKKRQMTVFLTTHYMEEAAGADYVVILDKGNIVANGTPLQLKNQYTGDFITIYNATEEEINSLGVKYEKLRDAYKIYVPNTEAATSLIIKNPSVFRDYEIIKGKMDDVFLKATGRNLTAEEDKHKD